MPIGDIYQVNNEFTLQGNANLVSWYLKLTAISDEDLVEADALAFGNATQGMLMGITSGNVSYLCWTARQVWPNASLPGAAADVQAGEVLCVDTSLPGQCSMVVTTYGDTENPTRHNRQRDFLTGFCCDEQTNGEWNILRMEAVADAYKTLGNIWSAGAGGNTFEVGLFSMSEAKKTVSQGGNPPVDEDAEFWWILQLVRVKQLVRTQRRRQPLAPCELFADEVIGPPE